MGRFGKLYLGYAAGPADELPRDQFGRVVTTHRCPIPGCMPNSGFLGPAKCRTHDVDAELIVGCERGPDKRWAVGLFSLALAPTEQEANRLADGIIAQQFPPYLRDRVRRNVHVIEVPGEVVRG